IFGEPMRFWRTAMPTGMLLRSAWSASHIADPDAALTLDAYKVSSGNHLAPPISLERFVDYGLWYQRTAVPDVDSRQVSTIEPCAEVEVIVRRSRVHFLGWKERLQPLGRASGLLFSPTDVGPMGISRLVAAPDILRKFPQTIQTRLRVLSTRPAGARWLRERL